MLRKNTGKKCCKLTDKQHRFVHEYLIDCNAKQAAIRSGYSAKSAEYIGHELLNKTLVAEAIADRQQALQLKLEMNQERILQVLARLVFFDPRKLFDKNGHLRPITELDEDTAGAIASMDVDCQTDKNGKVTTTKKIKFCDKNSAIEKAMKHLGLFDKEVNLYDQFKESFFKAMATLPEDTRNMVIAAVRRQQQMENGA